MQRQPGYAPSSFKRLNRTCPCLLQKFRHTVSCFQIYLHSENKLLNIYFGYFTHFFHPQYGFFSKICILRTAVSREKGLYGYYYRNWDFCRLWCLNPATVEGWKLNPECYSFTKLSPFSHGKSIQIWMMRKTFDRVYMYLEIRPISIRSFSCEMAHIVRCIF